MQCLGVEKKRAAWAGFRRNRPAKKVLPNLGSTRARLPCAPHGPPPSAAKADPLGGGPRALNGPIFPEDFDESEVHLCSFADFAYFNVIPTSLERILVSNRLVAHSSLLGHPIKTFSEFYAHTFSSQSSLITSKFQQSQNHFLKKDS